MRSLTLCYLSLTALLAAGLTVQIAYAARPMITDDARVVDPKSCQVESWVRHNTDGNEFWALPGCNFTGNLELTLGGGTVREEDGRLNTTVLQGKTLFKTLEPGGWAAGLVLGNAYVRPTHRGSNFAGNLYMYVPMSYSSADGRTVLHTNLGWLREKTEDEVRGRRTWGVGVEQQFNERNWLVAETFGQGGAPFFQVGVRHWIVPNRVQIDTTYGDRTSLAHGERWISIGLRLLSPAFLP